MTHTLTNCLQGNITPQDLYECPLHDSTLTAIENLDLIAIDGDTITENNTGDFYVDFLYCSKDYIDQIYVFHLKNTLLSVLYFFQYYI